MDDYVEAQVHGVVEIGHDVEAVVLDPCYRGTRTEFEASQLGVAVEWHEGRVLSVAKLHDHPDFRGAHVLVLGRRIAQDGLLDAAVIGRGAATGCENPRDLKKLWHCVARFGGPATSSPI